MLPHTVAGYFWPTIHGCHSDYLPPKAHAFIEHTTSIPRLCQATQKLLHNTELTSSSARESKICITSTLASTRRPDFAVYPTRELTRPTFSLSFPFPPLRGKQSHHTSTHRVSTTSARSTHEAHTVHTCSDTAVCFVCFFFVINSWRCEVVLDDEG